MKTRFEIKVGAFAVEGNSFEGGSVIIETEQNVEELSASMKMYSEVIAPFIQELKAAVEKSAPAKEPANR